MKKTDRSKQKVIEDFAAKTPMPVPASQDTEESIMGEKDERDADILALLREIKGSNAAMLERVDTVMIRLDTLNTRVNEISERTTETEKRISTAEDTLAQNDRSIKSLQKELRNISLKAEDLEGRARRNNVRILGVPEGSESDSMELFLEKLLPEILSRFRPSLHFTIERAHRIPGLRPAPGAPARPIIARLMNYRDRDALLQAARQQGPVQFENAQIQLYPDFTVVVQKARRSFDAARATLRKKQIKYAMLFPAKLRVIAKGKSHFFTDPREAADFADKLTPEKHPDSPPRDRLS